MTQVSDLWLNTGRLRLREFRPDDRVALLDFVHDRDQLRHLVHRLDTEAELDDFLALARTTSEAPARRAWHLAVEEANRPGCIGCVSLMIEPDWPTSAELGIWLKRGAWGRGYATEALRHLIEWGFQAQGLHRIWAECAADNPASARVLEKSGMRLEGRLREHRWIQDHYRTSLIYAVLEHDSRNPGPIDPTLQSN